jgi:transcriptional regulator with XRE-family HTH domain
MTVTASHPYGVWQEFRVIRTKDGQSLTDVHNKTGISLSHLSDLEKGRRLPTEAVLKKIARALNCPVSVLERHRVVDDEGNDIALREYILQVIAEVSAA